MPLVDPVPLVGIDEVGPVHFIAIGGAGMSGIAGLYHEAGVAVSGSDQADSAALRHLAEIGVTTYVGHDASHLGAARTVVVSSAIRESNVELAEARRRGLRVWHRSAALGALMLGRRGVAITGTAGKTTTSAMAAVMLEGAGTRPGFVIGAPLAGSAVSARLGTGRMFVIEADESDGSFLQYPVEVVVVTNVEADHLDNWGTAEAYADGFVRLCSAHGVRSVIACADDPGAAALAEDLRQQGRAVVTYGESASADLRLTDIEVEPTHTRATIVAPDDEGPIELRVPGRHNLLNALAAYGVGRAFGIPGAELRKALGAFTGTHRRFEHIDDVAGVRVYDDYAHHPTKVAAALTGARQAAGEGRLIVVFQPHLYSRTRDFAREFGRALALADVVVVTDVYAAREDPIEGVSGQLIADATARSSKTVDVRYVPDKDDAPAVAADVAAPGDLVVTVGAGDVTALAPRIVELLKERN